MRIPRFYQSQALKEGTSIILSKEASHHLLQVLRFKIGSTLIVFNGEPGEFSGTLTHIDKKNAVVQLHQWNHPASDSPLPIELGQGLSRGERMDYVIQKAVELGVTRITPLLTERCEVKLSPERAAKRLAHWQAIAIHACEQSGRCLLPTINAPVKLSHWLDEKRDGLQLICDPLSSTRVNTFATPAAATLLIGPEGGFSTVEVEAAEKSGFCRVSMGPRVLRTETAAVAALTLLQNQWGDL